MEVFWSGNDLFFPGTVTGFDKASMAHRITYDDGETQWLTLWREGEVVRWVDDHSGGENGETSGGIDPVTTDGVTGGATTTPLTAGAVTPPTTAACAATTPPTEKNSTAVTKGFVHFMDTGKAAGLTAMSYIKMMSHTAVINIGIFFGLQGRVITTSSACTSGSQAIGYAYEAIKYGHADVMIAGGAEELCPTMAIVFDTLFATCCKNDAPGTVPQPYDADRDGLVIGEGAATLILEEYEHAQSRGAHIYAELVGFGTNMDGSHVTDPQASTMGGALSLALECASLAPEAIDFVSGHGTATIQGDIAESHATAHVLGSKTPIHSLKSYFGHTLGACGGIEAWLTIEMMHAKRFAPTINLNKVDPLCADLDYITGSFRAIEAEHVMSNNFAFGGVNTSLIFKKNA